MKLTILGTGNAVVTRCYNTCFIFDDNGKYFLVDGGGGNGILRQLEDANIPWKEIRDIFITHKHLDHLTGIIWMIRMICQNMKRGTYEGEANLYGHAEVLQMAHDIACMVLQPKEAAYMGDRLHLITVENGETREIIGHDVTFFDIGSTKAKQFGFSMDLGNGEKLTCCGDEPYNPCEEPYANGSKWMLHEAFCLYRDVDRFKPYEKHHSTVKDACELAQTLGVENLILYHTEDKTIEHRKELYTAEGKPYFSGNLFVPDDLETFTL